MLPAENIIITHIEVCPLEATLMVGLKVVDSGAIEAQKSEEKESKYFLIGFKFRNIQV